ncbi:DUF6468 domain-containing protein [Thalassospira sp. MA62]|nr:DUF6468 domain-containing protein [Thalassospira sp. MA62]
MDFSFYLDLLMVILLVVTIIYAVILNRRLAAFRRSREDMENFLTAFNAANERAETSIRALKEMAEQSGDKLREDIERASALNEDLTFMADRGDSIANRLEKAASDANAGRRSGSAGGPNVVKSSGNSVSGGGASASQAGAGGKSGRGHNDVIDDRNQDRVGVETRAEELAARMVRDVESGSAIGGATGSGNAAGNSGGDRFGPERHNERGYEDNGYDERDVSSADVSDPYDQDEDAGRSDAERELLAALRSVR